MNHSILSTSLRFKFVHTKNNFQLKNYLFGLDRKAKYVEVYIVQLRLMIIHLSYQPKVYIL